jgi:hypothetical protein
MSLKIESIVWDGQTLATVLLTNDGRVTCTLPREAVYCGHAYNDVASWEVDRISRMSFQRIQATLLEKLQQSNEPTTGHKRRIALTRADIEAR